MCQQGTLGGWRQTIHLAEKISQSAHGFIAHGQVTEEPFQCIILDCAEYMTLLE